MNFIEKYTENTIIYGKHNHIIGDGEGHNPQINSSTIDVNSTTAVIDDQTSQDVLFSDRFLFGKFNTFDLSIIIITLIVVTIILLNVIYNYICKYNYYYLLMNAKHIKKKKRGSKNSHDQFELSLNANQYDSMIELHSIRNIFT